jgi:hypothetical protein
MHGTLWYFCVYIFDGRPFVVPCGILTFSIGKTFHQVVTSGSHV